MQINSGAVPATVIHYLLLTIMSHCAPAGGWEGVSNMKSQETCHHLKFNQSFRVKGDE